MNRINELSMQQLLKEWRKFTNISERVTYPGFYPEDFSEFMKLMEKYKDYVWVFIDTETTGLDSQLAHVQATQVAAIAYNADGFLTQPQEVQGGLFNMKLQLEQDTIDFMEQEPDEYDPAGRKKTIAQLLDMTQYHDGDIPYSTMDEVCNELTEYLNRMKSASAVNRIIIVAHNAPYDIKILNELYTRGGIEEPVNYIIDSIAVIDNYFKAVLHHISKDPGAGDEEDARLIQSITLMSSRGRPYLSSKLGVLANAFEIKSENWHEATADVAMTMDVLYQSIQYMIRKGYPSFPDARPKYPYKVRR